jgi:hypothetical protein
MIGFDHNRLADVNLITDNLRDRYKNAFSILKELVQNADDAGAGHLRFGIVPGNEEHPHPLLRGSGLVVVNDGAFTQKDFRAICSFGLNSKAADAATIGKFGLGMKSVFHLCEAIFFIAEGEGNLYRELLSPWGMEFRPHWDVSGAQWETLLEYLTSASLAAVKWNAETTPFILYLPLRRRAHLELPSGETAGAIIEDYPGDSGRIAELLSEDETGARLASLLPLLRSLRSIQVHLPSVERVPAPMHESKLEPEALRPLRHHMEGQSRLSSVVRHGDRSLRFVGWQRRVFTNRLTEIYKSAAWPTSWVRDELGRAQQALDKAQPHAAAIFGQEIAPGLLTIRWAVFLPIEEHEEQVDLSPKIGGYSLTVHGHFFVDAGRSGLYGLDADNESAQNNVQDEAWVRRTWNRELAGGAAMDMVIPALDRFSCDVGLSEERASAIVSAISTSNFWLRWRRSIAANHKWVRTITKDGCSWKMIGSEATLAIPRPPEGDPGRPWRVFPALDKLFAHGVLFDPTAQNLVAHENDLGSWDEEQVSYQLSNVNAGEVFSSMADAAYLADFLEHLRATLCASRGVQAALCDLLRRGVAAKGIHGLRSVAERVRRIAALVSRDRKLRISLRNAGIAVAEFLIEQPTATLAWPQDLDLGEANSNPDTDDVEFLLRALAGKSDHADACRQYAEDLLKQVQASERRPLLNRAGDLAILTAFDCRRGQKIAVTANNLRDLWQRRTLFRTGQGTTDRERAGLGIVLQTVLSDESLLVVNKELADLVFDDETVQDLSNCDSRGALHCLAHLSRPLGDSKARAELLRQVRLPDRDPIAIRGLRFLLHAVPDHLDSEAPLWVEQGQGSSAWRKVRQSVVPPADRWTVIDSELAAQLLPADWNAIKLHAISPDSVVRLVDDRGALDLVSVNLDRVEYDAILGYGGWEESVWRSLPFHLTTSGKRVLIGNENEYLEQPDIVLPDRVLAHTNVVVRSSDPRIASFQDQRIRKLDYHAAILIALQDSAPELWCESILDWLAKLPLSVELIHALSDRPWLRMNSGRAVKPTDFLFLPEIENQITEITQQSKAFGTRCLLPDHFHEHPIFERLAKELFPRTQSIGALARLVASAPRFIVGQPLIEEDDLRRIADILRLAPRECCSDGWSIVFAVCEAYDDEQGLRILQAIQGPIPTDRVKHILQWLSDSRTGADKAFSVYLRVLAASTRDREALRDLRLRAQDGSWRPSGELCYEVPGADKSCLLAREYAAVLEEMLESPGMTESVAGPSLKVRAHPYKIEEYFAPWLRRGLNAQVGALVTMITGRTPLRDYAASLLLPRTRNWLLSEFPWVPEGLHGPTPEQAFERYSFVFYVADTTSDISTVSLLGEPITVSPQKDCPHLLVGQPDRLGLYPQTRIFFRSIDISAFTDGQLSAILRTTAEVLLKVLYGRRLSLQQLWNTLGHTEQFHITTAEKLILEYLPFYLGQLRPQNVPRLNDQLRRVDDQRRLAVEYEGRPEEEQKKRDHEARRGELRDMLKAEPEVQKAVLEAVRHKLRDSQYQLSSIPFELFQNADDAYVQLREIRQFARIPEPMHKDRFVVLNTREGLSFFHWGRAVNSSGSHGFDGRKRGYHRDLEKMLMLSASEKQSSNDDTELTPLTGKFGLGFKSVLLACERPLILSGSLEVEIIGGVLPRLLPGDRAQTLRRRNEEYSTGESNPGTVVHLPEVTEPLGAEILTDFLRNGGYLTAFGLAIREITYVDDRGPHTSAWSGKTVAGIDAVQRGTIPARGLLSADMVKAVRIQLRRGSILLGLGSHGLRPLPKGTPAVWVTGPTREDEQFGFAVCAMFDVDPGRSRLSANELRNNRLSEELATELGKVFRALRTSGWDRLRDDLGLAREATEYEFWDSVWVIFQQTVARPDGAARRIMFRVLDVALGGISRDLAVIPNGQLNDLRALTSGNLVHHKLAGVLMIESCSAPLFGWALWKQRGLSPENVISARVWDALKNVGFNELPSVNLTTVASWVNVQTIRPEDARVLGEILKALPGHDDRKQAVNEDLEQAKKALKSVRFYSQAGTPECSGDLVARTIAGDEGRRAVFAPASRRLADVYDEIAVEFFRFCRGLMSTSPVDLAQWACQAESAEARRAALEYLLDGDLALKMRRELRILDVRGTWLANPAGVAGVTPELLAELRQPPLASPEQDRASFAVQRFRNPRSILERIEQWWSVDAAAHLGEYNRRLYPHARAPRLVPPWEAGFDRSEWLVLFGRAAFYRIGRSTDAQNRGFIEYAQHAGYWGVFAAQDPESKADQWMRILEHFCDEQIDSETWEHWMRSFPQFYKLSRWLEDYVELFLGLERQDSVFDLAAILMSRADAGQQGGGIDAPPPGLGIGACFVVRELLRFGHLRNTYAHAHAFVPTEAVRRLMNEIGLEIDNEPSVEVSPQVYSQIGRWLSPLRAIFGGAYDIPFQIIAADAALENELIH